jgi:hypothetical protein
MLAEHHILQSFPCRSGGAAASRGEERLIEMPRNWRDLLPSKPTVIRR